MFNALHEAERTRVILSVLAKNGFEDIASIIGTEKYLIPPFSGSFRETLKLSRSERIRKTVEELGSTFIKLAQILSTRPDLISTDIANEFSKLQDQVTPTPFDQIYPCFIEEFGQTTEDIFEGDLTLIASASLGQVYKGYLKNKEAVAVKILKPGVRDTVHLDIKIMYHLAFLLEDKLRAYGIDSPTTILNEFEKSIQKEFNYFIEAMNLRRFAKNFEDDDRISIPRYYSNLSTNSVLTMEFIEGIKVSNIAELIQAGIDPKEVAKNGFDLFCEQIFYHRFFHADPHPGNIFVIPDGKIVFIDFGMMGSVSEYDIRNFVDMIFFIVKGEEEKAALSLLKLSKIDNDNLDETLFSREVGEVIRTHFYGSLKEINIGIIMNDMIRLMRLHKVYFRENNYLLLKALITIEGVGQMLDPDFNAAKSIEPFISGFYRELYSFSALLSKISELPKEFTDLAIQLPEDIKTIIKKVKNGKLKIEFQHKGLETMETSIEKSANRLSLSIIIAAILIGSSLLLLAKTPPMFYGIPVLGLAGFITAFTMGIMLILSIIKQKH